eukprot:6477934-Amphidinium_carterae.2
MARPIYVDLVTNSGHLFLACKCLWGQSRGLDKHSYHFATAVLEDGVSKTKRKVKKKGVKGGAGGTWRLFLRQSFGRSRGLPNMSEASQAYRALKADGGAEWSRLVNLSKAIKNAAKMKGSAHPHSLGLSAKQQRRQAMSNINKQIWEYVKSRPLPEQAAAIINHAQGISSGSLAKGLGAAMKMARSMVYLHHFSKAEESRAAQKPLAEFDSGLGKEQYGALLAKAPWLKGIPLKCIPGGPMQMFCLESESVQKAFSAVSLMQERRWDALSSSLADSWERHHVLDTNVKAAGKEVKTKKTTLCQANCMCLCRGKGKLLRQCHGKLLCLLKAAFNTKLKKEKLSAGNVVIILSLESELTLPLHTSGASASSTRQLHMFGVALMYYTPYRPTLELLVPVDNPEPYAYAEGRNPIYCEVLHSILAK